MDVGEGNKDEKSQKHGDPCLQFPQQILIEVYYAPGTRQSASQAPAGQFPGGYKQPVPVVTLQGTKGAQRSFQLYVMGNRNLKGEKGKIEQEGMQTDLGQCCPIKYNIA